MRIGTADTDLLVLRVPAGKFVNGVKASVRDTDGTAIVVATGHKKTDTVPAAFGGTIAVTAQGKVTSVAVSAVGLDLGALSGPATLTFAVGPRSANANVTITDTGSVGRSVRRDDPRRARRRDRRRVCGERRRAGDAPYFPLHAGNWWAYEEVDADDASLSHETWTLNPLLLEIYGPPASVSPE